MDKQKSSNCIYVILVWWCKYKAPTYMFTCIISGHFYIHFHLYIQHVSCPSIAFVIVLFVVSFLITVKYIYFLSYNLYNIYAREHRQETGDSWIRIYQARQRRVDLDAMNLNVSSPLSDLTYDVSLVTHFIYFILIFNIRNCICYLCNRLLFIH